MRASSAIGLFLVSSVSIFGIVTGHSPNSRGSNISRDLPPVEPVYVNGQMGVYDPDTGLFVPSTSPLFDQTCERIQQKREQANGYYHSSSSTYHHWYYSSGSHSFTYAGAPSFGRSSSGGSTGWSSSSGSTSSGYSSRSSSGNSSVGSTRGGIGSTGHSFGGGSST
jgi:hypothetical protein